MQDKRRIGRISALLLSAALVLASACGDGKKDDSGSGAAGTAQPRVFDATVVPSPGGGDSAASATPFVPKFTVKPKDDARVTRLVIPKAKVDAAIQVKGLDANNAMQNPDGKDGVAWYDFMDRPGFGPNAVFSGHVDWYTGEVGVFWYLRDLKTGDEVTVKMSDGTELKYKVIRNDTYEADNAPVDDILSRSLETESVTLITCEGSFDRASQDYSSRRIIRAERIA